jgi:hypothetical protein
MKRTKPFNPYNVSLSILENIINDTYHANQIPRFIKVNDILYIQNIYTLIDYITNYNPLHAHYTNVHLSDMDKLLVQVLWKRTRNPRTSLDQINVSKLSGLTLLKLGRNMDQFELILHSDDKQFRDALISAAEIYKIIQQRFEDGANSYVYSLDWYKFEPSYSLTTSKHKPEAKLYTEVTTITGKGSIEDPEIQEPQTDKAINDILYLHKNIHYNSSLLSAFRVIRIDKNEVIHINDKPICLYKNKYVNILITQLVDRIGYLY